MNPEADALLVLADVLVRAVSLEDARRTAETIRTMVGATRSDDETVALMQSLITVLAASVEATWMRIPETDRPSDYIAWSTEAAGVYSAATGDRRDFTDADFQTILIFLLEGQRAEPALNALLGHDVAASPSWGPALVALASLLNVLSAKVRELELDNS